MKCAISVNHPEAGGFKQYTIVDKENNALCFTQDQEMANRIARLLWAEELIEALLMKND